MSQALPRNTLSAIVLLFKSLKPLYYVEKKFDLIRFVK